MTASSSRRLERVPAEGKIAGVCAGIAAYLNTDVALVRVLWILLSLVPGALIGGLIAYIAAWLLMPVSLAPAVSPLSRRVARSQTDRKIAGVCAGLARYFDLDVTAVRLIWVVLSIYPGAIILGVIAYAIAWFVIPAEPHLPMAPAAQPL
jgi:phage shock protein PspC (stress-responsive transcriptional regulator)